MSALASPYETIDDSVGHHGVSSVFSVRRNPKHDVKGLTTEELAARNDLVLALPARIEAIPDGTAGGPKSTSAWAPSTMSHGRFDDDYFQESHESSQFRHEFEMRKIKQAGLDALKNMASDMNELVLFVVYVIDLEPSVYVSAGSGLGSGSVV
uniref:Uncharacterized protein n=1 Tax=Brassica campestris TaxID=3711 RepID=M4EGG2_BRACM